MKTKSQAQRILEHLKLGKGITPMEALNMFGCFRLSARIADIKRLGYDVVTEVIKVGNGKRVARYYLA